MVILTRITSALGTVTITVPSGVKRLTSLTSSVSAAVTSNPSYTQAEMFAGGADKTVNDILAYCPFIQVQSDAPVYPDQKLFLIVSAAGVHLMRFD